MIKHGEAPFLECSTRGDKRFSAFCAYVNGETIEAQYQAAKVFKVLDKSITGLHWRQAKGQKAENAEECARLYSRLWNAYISQQAGLIDVLINANGLSDMFGKAGGVCQATELWRIRQEHLNDLEEMQASLQWD